MKSVKKLRIEPNFSEYKIFGISSHSPDYKLCWSINNVLKINLQKIPETTSDLEQSFKIFEYDYDDFASLYLVSNTDYSATWYEKSKHFQFFFIISGPMLKNIIDDIIKKINSLSSVLIIQELNISDKNIVQPLLSSFELKLTEISRLLKEQQKNNLIKTKYRSKKKNN